MMARRLTRARWIAVSVWCALVLVLIGIGVFVMVEPTPV
jgi:hypothetical protein